MKPDFDMEPGYIYTFYDENGKVLSVGEVSEDPGDWRTGHLCEILKQKLAEEATA